MRQNEPQSTGQLRQRLRTAIPPRPPEFVIVPHNPPVGGEPAWLETRDGVRLRAAFWAPPPGAPTVLLLQGRSEFIEKYFEVIGELQAFGLGVATFDWRGQGLSQRLTADPERGHVDDFADYVGDLRTLIAAARARRMSPPYVVLGHSMGGHIAMRWLQTTKIPVRRVVLTAPMLDIAMPIPRKSIARLAADIAVRLNAAHGYTFEGRGEGPEAPFDGNVLTGDERRYERTIAVQRADPRLALYGPTWGWLDAAFRSIGRINARGRLRRVRPPVLILSAERERLVDNQAHRRAAKLLPRGRVELIKGSRHEILMERDAIRARFWDLARPFFMGDRRPERPVGTA